MRLDPINLLFNNKLELDKNIYFIGGNEITLMEKVGSRIIEKYKTNDNISLTRIDSIDNFNNAKGLFENKSVYVGKNCKGFNEDNLNKIKESRDIFIFIQENSSKTKKLKNIFSKDKNCYLIDCYELDNSSKIKILNEFLKLYKLKIDKKIYWLLIEKLENKYIFLENTLNKILELEQKDLKINNLKKILTAGDVGKEKIFFSLLKNNKNIIETYREKF